ncbi:hypothetical protein Goari_021069, partial [Gossypium aridum]|nr:hypothetical protein [Gossypium aridum]
PPKTAAPPYKAPRTPTTPWNPPRRPSPPVKTIKADASHVVTDANVFHHGHISTDGVANALEYPKGKAQRSLESGKKINIKILSLFRSTLKCRVASPATADDTGGRRGFDQLWYILPSLALIKDIQNMCKRHWNISIKYIPREINRVADFLAKQALVSICLRNPIPAILQLLEVDARGSISAAALLS